MIRNSLRSGSVIAILFILCVCTVNKVSAQIISTFTGTGDAGYNGEGKKIAEAKIVGVNAAVAGADGCFYIADFSGNRIRKINAEGIITTIAGTGMAGYAAEGSIAVQANIAQPAGIALDNAGNIYFSEYANNCVRKIDKAGVITTVAGSGTEGFSGNGGAAVKAQLQHPGAIVLDKEGNLYISDADNNCVRKVTAAGIISMYAGNGFGYGTGTGSYSGDGGKATLATLNQPAGLALDAAGNLYISDCFNHCIRKVSRQGVITTVAGTGEQGYNGDNTRATKAQLKYPQGIAIDARGNIYIADNGNNRIRMIGSNGELTTVAGNGISAFAGDGDAATKAQIGQPSFVTIGNKSELYIGDNYNHRIRAISPDAKDNDMTTPVTSNSGGHMPLSGASASAGSGQ